MTIGDILAVIAVVLTVGITWAAAVLLTALALPARAARAQQSLLAAPGKTLLRGIGVALAFAVLLLIFGMNHAGPVRLIAGVLYAVLGALTALGSAGIVKLIGERIRETGTRMTPFASLTRGTVLYVMAGFLPIIGWFLIVPVSLLLSLGSGVMALRKEQVTLRPQWEGTKDQSLPAVPPNPFASESQGTGSSRGLPV